MIFNDPFSRFLVKPNFDHRIRETFHSPTLQFCRKFFDAFEGFRKIRSPGVRGRVNLD